MSPPLPFRRPATASEGEPALRVVPGSDLTATVKILAEAARLGEALAEARTKALAVRGRATLAQEAVRVAQARIAELLDAGSRERPELDPAALYMRGALAELEAFLSAPEFSVAVHADIYERATHEAVPGLTRDHVHAHALLDGARADLARKVQAAAAIDVEAKRLEAEVRVVNAELVRLGPVPFLGKGNPYGESIGGASRSALVYLLARLQVDGSLPPRRGYLSWPVAGPVTSGYGWRIHPIFRRISFHDGIDIAAVAGTPVSASRDGRVIAVGQLGAYGRIILIDHGRGVATLVAHLSDAVVAAGSTVKTGQTVGHVGCTGWCTGPHVHFSVFAGRNPENPSLWLRSAPLPAPATPAPK